MDAKTEDGDDAYMWWDADLRDPTGHGIFHTIDYLKNVFETQGPFDGILGFSQGISVVCYPKLIYFRRNYDINSLSVTSRGEKETKRNQGDYKTYIFL
jgi:hypothetical protein